MSDVARIAADVRAARTTAERVAAAALERIRHRERGPDALNAFVAVDEAASLSAAREVDARCARGEDLPLAGVPVALKDNLCTLDLPTTCASRILAGYVSPYEATVVRRLRDAGAVVIGKTNLDEFAMGSATAQSMFGRTLHPRDPERVPGGSSGGSAAAVAAGLVPVALGSDTGGSVRQPAAFCGVTGIKPTYGRVSRYGLVGFASSLDHVGVFGATVLDAAVVLQAIAGADARDATSAAQPVADLRAACGAGVAGLRVGVVRTYAAAADAAGAQACDDAAQALRSAGAIVRDVHLEDPHALIETYRTLSSVEAVTNLARFDGARFGARVGAATFQAMRAATREAGIGQGVRSRLELGERVLQDGADGVLLRTARTARLHVTQRLRDALADVDVLLTPATPTPAFTMTDAEGGVGHDSDVFLLAASLAGLPALSVPWNGGVRRSGQSAGDEAAVLPIGVQLIAGWWREDVIVRAAAVLERAP